MLGQLNEFNRGVRKRQPCVKDSLILTSNVRLLHTRYGDGFDLLPTNDKEAVADGAVIAVPRAHRIRELGL
jgi:hypothetical protein